MWVYVCLHKCLLYSKQLTQIINNTLILSLGVGIVLAAVITATVLSATVAGAEAQRRLGVEHRLRLGLLTRRTLRPQLGPVGVLLLVDLDVLTDHHEHAVIGKVGKHKGKN